MEKTITITNKEFELIVFIIKNYKLIGDEIQDTKRGSKLFYIFNGITHYDNCVGFNLKIDDTFFKYSDIEITYKDVLVSKAEILPFTEIAQGFDECDVFYQIVTEEKTQDTI